jgi:hypothetical protein
MKVLRGLLRLIHHRTGVYVEAPVEDYEQLKYRVYKIYEICRTFGIKHRSFKPVATFTNQGTGELKRVKFLYEHKFA